MATRYLKFQLKGTHALDAVRAALGEDAPAGEIVRIDISKDTTDVYFAVEDGSETTIGTARDAKRNEGTEVSLEDVLRIG